MTYIFFFNIVISALHFRDICRGIASEKESGVVEVTKEAMEPMALIRGAKHRGRGGSSNRHSRGFKHKEREEPSAAVADIEKEMEPCFFPISEAMATESVAEPLAPFENYARQASRNRAFDSSFWDRNH